MTVRLLVLDCDGVLSDNAVYVDEDGREAVRFWRGDGLGIQRVKNAGIPVHVVSSETNGVVRARCQKLGVACHQGHPYKGILITTLAADAGVLMDDVCFLGNDVNDLSGLCAVGYPYIVADAHSSLNGYGFRRTKARGGHGAVRELCDMIADGTAQRPGMNLWDMMLRWWG